MASAEGFEGWAILEIMGHRQVAGYVTDVVVFGAHMARVEVPEVPATKRRGYDCGFTHYYGGSAIFSCVPTTEELARAAAARFRTAPPQPLAPTSRQIAAPTPPDADLAGDDEEDDERGPPALLCGMCAGDNPTHRSVQNDPLCQACWDELPEDQRAEGALQIVVVGAAISPPPEAAG